MKKLYALLLLAIIFISGLQVYKIFESNKNVSDQVNTNEAPVGAQVDSYNGVAIFNNGNEYTKNCGKSYSEDGYYYGYKWQCVEFVKRFYYEALGHKMPDVYGNAKDFFDVSLSQGELNKDRDLLQYKNGGDVAPEKNDLIVFNDTKYGHVAIVTQVTSNSVDIIQQNIYQKPRQTLKLQVKNGCYTVGDSRKPIGWLRLQKNN